MGWSSFLRSFSFLGPSSTDWRDQFFDDNDDAFVVVGVVIVVVVVAHVVVVVIVFVDPRILPLMFGQNQVIDRWDLVVAVVDFVVLLLIPKTYF